MASRVFRHAAPFVVALMMLLAATQLADVAAFSRANELRKVRLGVSRLKATVEKPVDVGEASTPTSQEEATVDAQTNNARTESELKKGIAKFYDRSSEIWLDVWGEHMHHGYYPDEPYDDHKQAQIDMIDKSIDWAYGDSLDSAPMKSMVDVGCGVGGSSRHIVKRFGMSRGEGLSLSPYQIQRAKLFTEEQGLSDKVNYQVADAMKMPFEDDSFDMVWSMESGEHMPDKKKFVNELARVTAPGGRILIVTWCHRELKGDETKLTKKELKLLGKINDAYYLPDWCAGSRYVQLAEELGLEDVKYEDWTHRVGQFWPAVIQSALQPKNFAYLMRTNWTTIKATIAAWWMNRGFEKKLVKFVLITARKPT